MAYNQAFKVIGLQASNSKCYGGKLVAMGLQLFIKKRQHNLFLFDKGIIALHSEASRT